MRVAQYPIFRRTSHLVKCYAITYYHLENLKNFQTSGPAFSFCMSPANIVGGALKIGVFQILLYLYQLWTSHIVVSYLKILVEKQNGNE